MKNGKDFYMMTADYAFGHDLARVSTRFLTENGGNVETWYVEDRAHVDAMWSNSEEYENRLTSFFHDAFGMNGS